MRNSRSFYLFTHIPRSYSETCKCLSLSHIYNTTSNFHEIQQYLNEMTRVSSGLINSIEFEFAPYTASTLKLLR